MRKPNSYFFFQILIPILRIKREESLKMEDIRFFFHNILNPTQGLTLKYFQRNCLAQFIYIMPMLSYAIITEAIKTLFVTEKRKMEFLSHSCQNIFSFIRTKIKHKGVALFKCNN